MIQLEKCWQVFRAMGTSGMRCEALQGALITLTVHFGNPLLRSRDPQETVRLMVYVARQGRAIADGTHDSRTG